MYRNRSYWTSRSRQSKVVEVPKINSDMMFATKVNPLAKNDKFVCFHWFELNFSNVL